MLVYSLPLQWRLVLCNALGTLWAVLQADYVNSSESLSHGSTDSEATTPTAATAAET